MMRLELRLEQHDDRCRQCGDPKPSSRDCASCALETAEVGSLRGESAQRALDRIEKARAARRQENGLED